MCYLQVLDVIQSSKLPVKFCDAVADFFYLEEGYRCLSLMLLSSHKRGAEAGNWLGCWQTKREVLALDWGPDLLPVRGDDAHTSRAQASFTLLGGRGQELFQV